MKANKDLNHTASHLLAAAILKLYPDVKLGFGPPIEEGFYYDFEFTEPITDDDLKKIEKEMKKIVSGGYKIEKAEGFSFDENQIYKQELFNDLKAKGFDITYYGMNNPSNGKSIFTDLCKGGHVDSVSKIKHFKLLSLAGAYWRGDSNNIQLTRIYGTAWDSKEELDEYLNILKERKERDHRKIGKEMGIFTFNLLAGQGFPIYLKDGQTLKNEIQKYIREVERKYLFEEVHTPSLGSIDLYKLSGHWDHYSDDMYPPVDIEHEKLVMRPMTCPHHLLIYKMARRTYRDLPMRLSEHARLFRYEKSGALTGLERVRSMELTDAHILVTPDQVVDEFKWCYKLLQETLNTFNIEIDYVSLSLRDPKDKEKYFDDDKMWNEAEKQLRGVLDDMKVEYKEMIGEAAFYGPKMDIQVKTSLGHEITLSTLQLDFLLPEKFELEYIDSNEERKRPILIHRGLIGTYERFISILLEQTKGNLPFWLAPKQVTIIPINNDIHLEYSKSIYDELFKLGFRVELDDAELRMNKKIRNSQTSKTKFQLIIGDNEVEHKTVNVREYGSDAQKEMKLIDLIKLFNSLKK